MRLVLQLSEFPTSGSYALLAHPDPSVRTVLEMLDTVLTGIYPRLQSFGIVDRAEGHRGNPHVVTTTPRCDVPSEVPSILMPLDMGPWAYFPCLYTCISHGLLRSFPRFSVADWREYLTLRGRRSETDRLLRWTFLTNRHRLGRRARTGIGRWLPAVERVDPYLTRRYIYGTSIFSSWRAVHTSETVQGILGALSDDASRRHYSTLLFGPRSTVWRQYFDDLLTRPQYLDYVALDSDSVVLNLGVGTGCEIPNLLASDVRRIYNVDPGGQHLFSAYVKAWTDYYSKKIVTVERILHDRDTELEVRGADHYVFDSTKPVASQAEAPMMRVRASTLETLFRDYAISKIDLIKADIEGAERTLVAQLPPIIERFRPQLAICIYHSIHDYVDIPRELMRICPRYDFYVKHYGYEKWETVMYCIPREMNQDEPAAPREPSDLIKPDAGQRRRAR